MQTRPQTHKLGRYRVLTEERYKDLFQMLLFLAKEARVLDPGLCERSMESLEKG